MKWALIEPRPNDPSFPTGYRIAQVVDAGGRFEVSPPLRWHRCGDKTTERCRFDGKKVLPALKDPAPPTAKQQVEQRLARDPVLAAVVSYLADQAAKPTKAIVQELAARLEKGTST